MIELPSATPVELLKALAVFAEPPGAEHARVADALGFDAPPTASEFGDVFLFQLYPFASVHVGAEGMLGGEARRRVAGFWRALARTPPAEPDHLAALLALYASLSTNEEPEGARHALLEEARAALLHEHLGPWLPHYLARVVELAPGFYSRWAELLSEVLMGEAVGVGPPARLPLHLREAPGLPDPRERGGDAFLAGLLSTVRTGVILSRADLARVAAALDLGLRAGERRYALASLLGQDPVGVLRAVAAEARRQGVMHADRAEVWGPSSDFLAERARKSAELLGDLAQEGFDARDQERVGSEGSDARDQERAGSEGFDARDPERVGATEWLAS